MPQFWGKILSDSSELIDNKIINANEFEIDVKKIFEFSVFLCISWLDISAATKLYLKSEEIYLRSFSVRNLTIYLNEGYKKLHHFTASKRNNSLWIQNISKILEKKDFNKYKLEFELISNKLIEYETEFQNNKFKLKRNIFVHYEGSPIKVYEAFNEIDILNLMKNATKYLNITSEIIVFTSKITDEINKKFNT